MKHRRYAFAFGILLAGLVEACDILVAVTKIERSASLVFNTDTAAIVAPDTVTRGTSFDIRFQTREDGCTELPAREAVQITGDSVLVWSWVRTTIQCNNDKLLLMPHSVSVTLDRPGAARIYVFGRKMEHGVAGDFTLSRRIFVK
jgi:hypothetical protein